MLINKDEITDELVRLHNDLADFSHSIMDLMEEWKRREEENHVILLKTLDDTQRILKHLGLTEKTSNRQGYM